MDKLQEMKIEVDKLQKLLEDEQPGLSTWHTFVHERMEKICELYYGYKPSTIKPLKR